MNLKIHLLIIFLLFAFCFLIYFSTLCPTVTWAHFAELGPKLLVQIYTEPLSFSQNHLIYLTIAKVFSIFNFQFSIFNSSPAFPINLLSTLFSSLTMVVTYLIIFSLSPTLKLPSHLTSPFNLAWIPAIFASLSLAFSQTFWSQAVVTQTTSFNIFLFAFFLLFIIVIAQGKSKKAKLPKAEIIVLFILGTILVLNNLPLNLSFRLRTPKQFWQNFEIIVDLVLTNFGGMVLFLALLGLFFGFEKKLTLLILTSILIGQSLLDSVFLTSTTPPFFLPSFLTIAILAGLGFKVLLEIILALSFSDLAVSFENQLFLLIFRLKKAGQFLRYVALLLIAYFVVTIISISIRKSYPLVNLKNEKAAFNFGQGSLAVLPENSLVFCETDRLFYTLEYFQKVVKPEKEFEILAFGKNTKEEVKENIHKRPVFFALVKTPVSAGETIGRWEEYTLVSKKPLYQVIP